MGSDGRKTETVYFGSDQLREKHPEQRRLSYLFCLTVLQFCPYWQGEGISVSIQGYVWFPTENDALTAYLEESVGEFDLNSVIGMPILVLVLAVAAIACCVKLAEYPVIFIMGIVAGISGLWGYLGCSVYRVGAYFGLHVALCAVILLLGIAGLVIFLQARASKQKAYGA